MVSRGALLIAISAFAVSAWLQVAPGSSAGSSISLNSSSTYQTITGWEATAWAAQTDSAAFPVYKELLYDQVVTDLGINRLRVPVTSGSENTVDAWKLWRSGQLDSAAWRCVRYATVNDNDDPFVINPAGFQFAQLDDTVENVVLPIKSRLEGRGKDFT
jgi:hypothetical protein